MNRNCKIVTLFLVLLCLSGLAAPAQSPQFRCAIIPETPRLGEPVTIAVAAEGGAAGGAIKTATLLAAGGQRLSSAAFFPVPASDWQQSPPQAALPQVALPQAAPLIAAVLAVPSTAQPGRAVIQINSAAGPAGRIEIDIAGRDFASETIELNAALTGIRTAPDPQKTAESEQLWAILNRAGTDVYCSGSFRAPVTSERRTSFFGDRRVFKYSNGSSDTSVHAGVDYGVPTGTVVSACASGRVVLARNRIVTGNSVIIEHLPGVYSLYYHLDSIEVAEGAQVSTGSRLGLSGATGLATGPHLHWEVRVCGENTDPDAFVSRPILDTAALFGKIF